MVGEAGLEPTTPGLEGRFGPLPSCTRICHNVLYTHRLTPLLQYPICLTLPSFYLQGPPKIPHSLLQLIRTGWVAA